MLALREVKRQIIETIRKYNKRIREIDLRLGQNRPLFTPELETCEEPGKRMEYNMDMLLEYEKAIPFPLLYFIVSISFFF